MVAYLQTWPVSLYRVFSQIQISTVQLHCRRVLVLYPAVGDDEDGAGLLGVWVEKAPGESFAGWTPTAGGREVARGDIRHHEAGLVDRSVSAPVHVEHDADAPTGNCPHAGEAAATAGFGQGGRQQSCQEDADQKRRSRPATKESCSRNNKWYSKTKQKAGIAAESR